MPLHLSTPRDKDIVSRDAVFDSEARTWRYWLSREWSTRDPVAVVCGVNPSKADHEVDDPTIIKLMRWLRMLDFGGLIMVNEFGLVSTDPAGLDRVPDPVGPHNDHYLGYAMEQAKNDGNRFIVAWGKNGIYKNRHLIVMRMLSDRGVQPWCFGTNGDGTPCHPVRLPYSAKLREYQFKEAA